MSEFVQIIRLGTDDFEAMNKLNEQYRADTAGRSTYTHEMAGRDLDTGEYVVIVTFPSRAAADENNALPETNAIAEKMAGLATSGPTFSNIEVTEGA